MLCIHEFAKKISTVYVFMLNTYKWMYEYAHLFYVHMDQNSILVHTHN